MAAAPYWIEGLGVKFESAITERCDVGEQKKLYVDDDIIYMVTTNPGLVHLGALIREYLYHFRPNFETPPNTVGRRLN